ncbi:MAG: DNA mismatch endonuclease Vsr [Bacteroidia bacterium]|nr:DNA mismatch endonuclease Vsr [Bacteroidia bacterium]
MMDVVTKEKRSEIMSKIRSKHTAPEMKVRSLLFSLGFRFRLHKKNLPGKPDIVLPKYKTLIFVHGCFWHGHDGCKYHRIPKSNNEYWVNKINNNKIKDIEHYNKLVNLGWKVIVIWECQIKRIDQLTETLLSIRS